MSPPLDDVLTSAALRRLAGPRSFERGEEYADFGAVGVLQWEETSLRAAVQGQDRYRVRLEVSGGELVGSCSCPLGREGAFCKHCVAVGLVWLSRVSEEGTEPTAPTRGELHARLTALGPEALADLLIDEAEEDERLHARLLALTASPAGSLSGPDFGQLAHAFDVAIDPGGFVSWREAYAFARGLEEVTNAVEAHLGSGHGAEIAAFCEHALRRVEEAFEYVDDSDGGLGDAKARLEELHLAACREARPDPRELAERLFRWELASGWETFAGAVERYAEVLGESGIARYRQLAETAWANEPELGPTDERHSWDSRRFRLSRIMEELARREGDVDALVAVLARDRSSPYRYLEIAESLLAAGRAQEATEWAERGVAAFRERPDPRLLDFLCDRYGDAGRHDQAVQLAWKALEESPCLGPYQRLARSAGRAATWNEWRERALDLLRSGSDATGRGRRTSDRSEVVGALLWEGNDDGAWQEAQEGGCRRDLWLSLARRRERDHPADALEVYRAQIEPAIRHGDNHTYEGAIEWLTKVEGISIRLGREGEFDRLIREIREQHRAKRNLIKRLDEKRWGGLQSAPTSERPPSRLHS